MYYVVLMVTLDHIDPQQSFAIPQPNPFEIIFCSLRLSFSLLHGAVKFFQDRRHIFGMGHIVVFVGLYLSFSLPSIGPKSIITVVGSFLG